ncbi:MAG: GNAT family N-acetyltransferase [Rhodanobacteraceae bacterium]|nr:GNAT family N-acetyltransferase [Rhodanobacteraceae bacterium]
MSRDDDVMTNQILPKFSNTVCSYWEHAFASGKRVYRDEAFSLTVDADLDPQRQAMLLCRADGQSFATVTPALAARLELGVAGIFSVQGFRQRLASAGVALHGADYLFYYSDAGRETLHAGADGAARRLTDHDAAAFEDFCVSASAQDLDDAYVGLDHWAAFGCFEHDHLVCVASAYPWGDAPLADLGVLTLASHRGKGLARQVVRAISRHAFAQGHEAQYRCQLDNAASVALAAAAGLNPFGTWQVVSPD